MNNICFSFEFKCLHALCLDNCLLCRHRDITHSTVEVLFFFQAVLVLF